jgi:hypothetical protein
VVEAEMVEVEEMAAVAETSHQIVGNDLGFPTLAISEHRLAGFNGFLANPSLSNPSIPLIRVLITRIGRI